MSFQHVIDFFFFKYINELLFSLVSNYVLKSAIYYTFSPGQIELARVSVLKSPGLVVSRGSLGTSILGIWITKVRMKFMTPRKRYQVDRGGKSRGGGHDFGYSLPAISCDPQLPQEILGKLMRKA